ncbi:MAG: glycoside hydrolase family 38 C-terminal domain-containing protein [Planctomycetota bacterium]
MKTIHLIFNAHIDPIWLWPWQAGLDAALATCRNACDRLDAHKDFYFNRGEAWVYAQIERLDPELFERIRRHVAGGRWSIVGGWLIQPDCNLPSAWGMKQQIELGQKYFLERFGIFPHTAYNVDSFGHAACLPRLMSEAGQTHYVMMRPQEHELALPARLFRWRGYKDGPEIVTFRIAGGYCVGQLTLEHLRRATTELPPGLEHTMCFAGLGDHGGGPTEKQIAWCRESALALEGWKLEFSTPERFFRAIEPQTASLPLVTGELQHHAIGCYTVHRQVKTGVRRAEHLLRQAEIVRAHLPLRFRGPGKLEEAWERVCFNQFHDTLGGTCIPSAYAQVGAQLSHAAALADDEIHGGLRRLLNALPGDPRQRMVFFNASDEEFDGYAYFEPWLEWGKWGPGWRVLDEQGRAVPCQTMHPEASCNGLTRLVLRLSAAPGQLRVLRIDPDINAPPPAPSRKGRGEAIKTAPARIAGTGAAVNLSGQGSLSFGQVRVPLPHLELLPDPSDTWSHGLDRYAAGPGAKARWKAPVVVDTGPLMASLLQHGIIGRSALTAEYRVFAEERCVEMRLRVHWVEKRKILKLVWPLKNIVKRWDGVMGGELERPCDGKERPLRDRTLLETWHGRRAGVVCPDVFALDCDKTRLRLTLLRSALMAHHAPHPGDAARFTVSDQGEHEFRFQFHRGKHVTGQLLDRQAFMYQRPLAAADLTRGMPARMDL